MHIYLCMPTTITSLFRVIEKITKRKPTQFDTEAEKSNMFKSEHMHQIGHGWL